MRTRSSNPSSAVLPTHSDSDKPTAKPTPSSQPAPVPEKALKTLILPSNASDDARFVTLDSPATGRPSPYYFCPRLGLYEFTLIGPPAKAARSILFAPASDKEEEEEEGEKEKDETGYISRLAQLHVATPVDVLFFVLPVLAPAAKRGQAQRLFQPLDDILDAQEENVSKKLRNILLHCTFREAVEKRMAAVCDTVDAGETMFRISEEKLVAELFSKAERMAENGLPASMEERFVRRELELPVLSISRDNTNTSKSEQQDETPVQNAESQESSTSTENTIVPSPITPPDMQSDAIEHKDGDGDDTMRHLLRLRTSLSFLLASYLPPHLRSQVETSLQSAHSPRDFTPLTTHLKHITTLRAKAQESRALYGGMSRKRGIEDEEDGSAMGGRAEKKRKEEEEEKRKKAGESRGVRDLKKVNTAGMMKLSAFFGKATTKK